MTEQPLPPAENSTLPSAPPAAVSFSRKLLAYLFLAAFVVAMYVPGWKYAEDKLWLYLFTRWMALALFALSVDLVWGYTGLLTLGHGLYFGLGAYLMAYFLDFHLWAREARDGVAGVTPTDFMVRGELTEVPKWMSPLANLSVTMILIVVIPTLVAVLFGLLIFRLRVKGVFFSLVTQALLLAVFLFVDRMQRYTGGVVGMPGLPILTMSGELLTTADILHLRREGQDVQRLQVEWMQHCYLLVTSILAVAFVGCFILMRSKYGKVLTAIRDNETRVLALGYNTGRYKTFIYALAGLLAGLAGALRVLSERTVGPGETFGIAFSIEAVIMVAVGGRGTLYGAVLGAILVNVGKTYMNTRFTEAWPLILGSLFIVVVLFLPNGILALLLALPARIRKLLTRNRSLGGVEGSS